MKVGSGGGFRAIRYTWKKGREAGGIWKLYKAMRSRNACKTCALGMGGQKGGMVNEIGIVPRSLQEKFAGDGCRHAARHRSELLASRTRSTTSKQLSPRELEHLGRLIHPHPLSPRCHALRDDHLGRGVRFDRRTS